MVGPFLTLNGWHGGYLCNWRQQMEEAQRQAYQGQQQAAPAGQQSQKQGAKGKYDIEGEYIQFEDLK